MMPAQLDLFAVPPPVRMPYRRDMVDERPENVEVLRKEYCGGRLCIELAEHTDGRWMWSASYMTPTDGNCYAVMAKWGKFADTRQDALVNGVLELRTKLRQSTYGLREWMRSWLDQVVRT